MDTISIELLNSIDKGIYRNLWSSNNFLGGILSGPSDLVGLSVLILLNTAATVMTISGKNIPFKLSAQFSSIILYKVYF